MTKKQQAFLRDVEAGMAAGIDADPGQDHLLRAHPRLARRRVCRTELGNEPYKFGAIERHVKGSDEHRAARGQYAQLAFGGPLAGLRQARYEAQQAGALYARLPEEAGTNPLDVDTLVLAIAAMDYRGVDRAVTAAWCGAVLAQ